MGFKEVISNATGVQMQPAAQQAPAQYPPVPQAPVQQVPVPQQVRVPHYEVVQVVLKEKLVGTGSRNLSSLENAINAQARRGYRLHTVTTASSGSTGIGGGDRIQATLVFESL